MGWKRLRANVVLLMIPFWLNLSGFSPVTWHFTYIEPITNPQCGSSGGTSLSSDKGISYYGGNCDLKYGYYSETETSDWAVETVDGLDPLYNDQGTQSSLVFDRAEMPNISYHDDSNLAVRYAYKDSTGWHHECIDGDSANGLGDWKGTSLVLDDQDQPHVSYTGGQLRLASRVANDADCSLRQTYWNTERIDWGAGNTSLTRDSKNRYRIAYLARMDASHPNALRYAYQTHNPGDHCGTGTEQEWAGGWQCETVDPSLVDTSVMILDKNPVNPRPAIAYHVPAQDWLPVPQIRFVCRLPVRGWQGELVAVTDIASRGLSLDIRGWDNRPTIAYITGSGQLYTTTRSTPCGFSGSWSAPTLVDTNASTSVSLRYTGGSMHLSYFGWQTSDHSASQYLVFADQ